MLLVVDIKVISETIMVQNNLEDFLKIVEPILDAIDFKQVEKIAV